MRLSVSCLPGTEDLLENELAAIGVSGAQVRRQAVAFEGNDETMLRCLTELPSALRVYQEITSFTVRSQADLYRSLRKVKWDRFLRLDQSFSIEVIESGGKAPGPIRYITLKAKDALVDYFRETSGKRPSVDRGQADIHFLILFDRDGTRVYRDAAGRPLSQRGYRLRHAGAPLNEALAWALLNYSGFVAAADTTGTGGMLIDPMCGSGTIPIEAALLLKKLGIPPHPLAARISEEFFRGATGPSGDTPSPSPSPSPAKPSGAILLKKADRSASRQSGGRGEDYMCFSWPDKGSRLRGLFAGLERGASHAGQGSTEPWLVLAGDIDQRALGIARENARRAGVEGYLAFFPGDFLTLRQRLDERYSAALQSPGKGDGNRILILNPPYDHRLTLDADSDLYRRIGDCLKNDWKGASAHIFSANRDALKQIGLRSERRVSLKNGPLQASLHSFSLY
jgi:23S rRNA G2445 N2-methylase RlmL